MKIGTRIAVVRRARKWTQRYLEVESDVTQQTLSNIESGYRPPIGTQEERIKAALNWNADIDAALDMLDAALRREANDGE